MLLFGGNTDTTESVDTLHILDLVTMKWTQAPSSLDARSDMACSVSGDNFIVWGGYKRNPVNVFVPSSPTPIIYNIYLGKWTTTFTRGSHPNGSTYPTPTPTWNPNPPKKPINGAAIGGGVAVGIVVIAAIAFFFLRRRRQTRKQHQPPAVPSKETEAAHQEQGHRDRILATNEDPPSGPAPYTYSLINSGINHNYSQINPGVTFNSNTNNGYSNNSFNNNYTHANNYNYDQTPQVFAMTERHSQPNSPQASSGSASTWKTGTTYSLTTPTYIPTSPTSPTYASSYSTAYSTPPIPARPKHISNTIATPIDPSNQDHIRELEYQIEMSNRQLEYALRNLKCAPAVATVNNPQYNPILPELEPPSTVLTRGPQGTDIQMVPMTTTPGAPQLDQTELVHKIEKMQSELRNLHAQLST
ncbi:MAG: hypothetical protein JOS17DRAFT_804865 [Linnemannia elongata]|nr:MAG: hypothetical protein JOS17DRAFT_804865 [Linnemannia elongata]